MNEACLSVIIRLYKMGGRFFIQEVTGMNVESTQFITPMKSISKMLEQPEAKKETEGAQLFGDILRSTAENVKQTQADVENKQYLLATGQLDDAHSLPIAEAKAAVSLDLMITLRNKVIEGYNELVKINL